MRTARKAYYRLLSRITDVEYPPDVGDFQLVDKMVLNELKRSRSVQPFMRIMTFECGFKSVGLPYVWKERIHGVSRNRFGQLISQGFLGIISHSIAPLRLAMLLGFVIAGLSFLYVIAVIVMWFAFGDYAPRGIFTIIAAIFFFGGVQLIFTGIMGEYIGAIFNQVRGRPIVIERERVNFDDDEL